MSLVDTFYADEYGDVGSSGTSSSSTTDEFLSLTTDGGGAAAATMAPTTDPDEAVDFDVDPPSVSPTYTIRHVTLAYLPHISGALSIVGSAWIILDILLLTKCNRWRQHWVQRGTNTKPHHDASSSSRSRTTTTRITTYHRLLVGLSITDVIASIGMLGSTWPIPVDSLSGKEYMSLGTITTCNIQGFLIQLGTVSTPIYNSFLSIYYLLLVKYNWKKHDPRFVTLERYIFHPIPWILGFGTSTTSLVLQQYNSANLWCWIAPTPYDCIDSLRSHRTDGSTSSTSTCIRGDNAWLYRLLFYFIWLWLSVLCVMGCTLGVLHTVMRQVRKLRSDGTTATTTTITTTTTENLRHIRNVAKQSVMYVGAFFLTALFPSLVRMLQAKWNCTTTYFPLSLMTATFMPLQGFWNFLIYIQPKYQSWRRRSNGTNANNEGKKLEESDVDDADTNKVVPVAVKQRLEDDNNDKGDDNTAHDTTAGAASGTSHSCSGGEVTTPSDASRVSGILLGSGNKQDDKTDPKEDTTSQTSSDDMDK